MSGKPRTLVIRTAGTNCDGELCRAFEMAGSAVELVHVDALIASPSRVGGFDLVGFPGGFSYGDDIASGRILAMKLREKLYPALRDAAARGCLMIGVCNGFQTLVQCGLLPGPRAGESWPAEPPEQRCALTDNAGGRFVDRWVGIEAPPSSVCVWTRGLSEVGESAGERPDLLQLPVAHGEGRFVCRTPQDLAELERTGRVALRYTDNYNGSENAIAGICDPSGRVFGLMPHPERYLDWTRHPYWTRLASSLKKGQTPGAMFFRNAVEAAVGVGV